MIPALDKALMVLEYLNEHKKSTSKDIEKNLNINHTTLFRILKTLVKKNYIYKLGQYYYLGPALQFFQKEGPLENKNLLNILSNELNCSCMYVKYLRHRCYVHSKVVNENSISMQDTNKYVQKYIHNPYGIVLYAYSDNSIQKEILSHYPLEKEELFKKYANEVLTNGYFDDGERIYEGIRRLGFPIVINNQLIGCIVLAFIASNFKYDVAKLVLNVKEKIEKEIYYV